MNTLPPLPELLAPAGSYDAMLAAVEAGADAVYLGATQFSARAYAQNFSGEEAERAIAYCHAFGVRVYATMNTLLFDRECEAFLRSAADFYRMGADGVIAADLGGIRMLRRYLPALPVHVSTQASVHSLDGLRAFAELGAVRVVLARELSLENIRYITTHAPCQTEIFLHGALCVSHSGQCLLSSLIGGRSGNRGACAQPCRLPYNGHFPLSLRDLSLADHIPALIASGVSSLKIEGRMKSPAYVYGVVSVYRRLLDERRAARPEENRYLRELFSRDGFTDAYFRGKPQSHMTGIRKRQDIDGSRRLPPPPPPPPPAPPRPPAGSLPGARPENSPYPRAGAIGHAVAQIPEPARSAPLDAGTVCAHLSRMGGTPYTLAPENIRLRLGSGLNLSPAVLNALRREALADLDRPGPDRTAFALPPLSPDRAGPSPLRTHPPFRTALFFDPAVFDAIGNADGFFDLTFLPLFRWREAARPPQGICLPPVITDAEAPQVLDRLREAAHAGITHALVGHIGWIRVAQDMGFSVIGDFRLNITNRESVSLLRERFGLRDMILSPELSLPRLRDLPGGSVIVFGRIPLMLLERCLIRENFGCAHCNHAALTDRRGAVFPLLRVFPHRNLLLNSLPTYMGDRVRELEAAHISRMHFLFTSETPDEAAALLSAFRHGRSADRPVRGIVRS